VFFRGARTLVPALTPEVRPGPDGSTVPASADEAQLLLWVRRIQEGDLTAFELLYQHTRGDAARTLRHLVGNRVEVGTCSRRPTCGCSRR
jgi:RNA polymerase sigma-70 factor (ECF subfamily)